MTLIDAEQKVHFQVYDDEFEDLHNIEISIKEIIETFTEEGFQRIFDKSKELIIDESIKDCDTCRFENMPIEMTPFP